MADESDTPDSAASPPSGTPPQSAPQGMPGVAAAQPGMPGGSPPSSPGVLPPQGAAVPMQVKAAGDHAVGMDIMRGVIKAMLEALRRLGTTKEAETVADMLRLAYRTFSNPEGGKEDSVDPHMRIAHAIAQNRRAAQGPAAPPGGGPNPGAPGLPPQMAMRPRGPIPAAGGVPQ